MDNFYKNNFLIKKHFFYKNKLNHQTYPQKHKTNNSFMNEKYKKDISQFSTNQVDQNRHKE